MVSTDLFELSITARYGLAVSKQFENLMVGYNLLALCLVADSPADKIVKDMEKALNDFQTEWTRISKEALTTVESLDIN